MDTATKTGIDAAKTATKTGIDCGKKATGDVIGNKIPDKITSVGKKLFQQVKNLLSFFHQKKDSKLLMILNCFE